MPEHNALQDLELLIRAHYALIVLDTVEPERAEALVRQAASELSLHYYYWTRSKGVRRGNSAGDPYFEDTQEPEKALRYAEQDSAGVYLFRDLTHYLENPLVVSHLLDVVSMFEQRRGALVVVGSNVRLPDPLRPHATFFRLPAPSYDDYRILVERVIREQSARMRVSVELTPQERTRLVQNLMGLTLVEAEKIVTRQIVEDGFLRSKDIEGVIAAKRQAVQQDGLLEYHAPERALNEVAGLAGLKQWLAKRRAVVADPQRATEFGLRFPKGILLLGVPGCGKSMCAKAVATEWGLPLLKLDPANLYDKYIGDSEKNFKRALQTAERMAPVVLWIDELEKAFAQGGDETDGGVSRRVFGSFLAWLQDRRGDVFVVATSNDVSRLPPEFIRKGRFDEVFFVDLPTLAARQTIFDIHLGRRKQVSTQFDLVRLADASHGFSGAEIEESVVAGLFAAFAANTALTTDTLLNEIRNTRPLALTMTEKIEELRAWARERTVMADM
ncbi:MAG TPA: AAA family ATPase [Gemmatimonadaceae bacterium]|nr:AAA family ATPase [Gemmatimonadaceae bacterium]